MILKKQIKKITKKYLDRIYFYFKNKDKELTFKKKQELISKMLNAGFGLRLNGEKHVFSSPKKVIIGNNVHIGNNFFAKTEGGLIIGDNTHISRNVTIYTENHNYQGKGLPYDNTTVHKPVKIGLNVWIGMNVSIVPGVSIGDGAIIGMGTIVNRNIEPMEIIGSPRSITIKNRNEEHYNKLVKEKAFGGRNGKLLTKNELTSYFRSYKDQRNNPVLFVLGTGRSGTTSISSFFNSHPDCKAFHEHFQQIIRISTEFAYSKDTRVLKELESIFEIQSWEAKEGQLLVHIDQRFWNLVPFLSKYFPNSKFIHLIREPYSCIKSMAARYWYMDNEYPELNYQDWAMYRLQGDKVGEMSTLEWNAMSQIEKCTWYWCYINDTISSSLDLLPLERKLKINLEDLDKVKEKMLNFLNLNYLPLVITKENKVRSHHKDTYTQLNDDSSINVIIKNTLRKFKQKTDA